MADKNITNRWLVFSIVLALILGPVYSAKAEDNEAGHEVQQREKKIEEIDEEEEKRSRGNFGHSAEIRPKGQAERVCRIQL
jgi:hypothetical protein